MGASRAEVQEKSDNAAISGLIEFTMSDASESQEGAEDVPAASNEAEAEAGASEKPTAEEQMAQFEDALKEEDWGHQPC